MHFHTNYKLQITRKCFGPQWRRKKPNFRSCISNERPETCLHDESKMVFRHPLKTSTERLEVLRFFGIHRKNPHRHNSNNIVSRKEIFISVFTPFFFFFLFCSKYNLAFQQVEKHFIQFAIDATFSFNCYYCIWILFIKCNLMLTFRFHLLLQISLRLRFVCIVTF